MCGSQVYELSGMRAGRDVLFAGVAGMPAVRYAEGSCSSRGNSGGLRKGLGFRV